MAVFLSLLRSHFHRVLMRRKQQPTVIFVLLFLIGSYRDSTIVACTVWHYIGGRGHTPGATRIALMKRRRYDKKVVDLPQGQWLDFDNKARCWRLVSLLWQRDCRKMETAVVALVVRTEISSSLCLCSLGPTVQIGNAVKMSICHASEASCSGCPW